MWHVHCSRNGLFYMVTLEVRRQMRSPWTYYKLQTRCYIEVNITFLWWMHIYDIYFLWIIATKYIELNLPTVPFFVIYLNFTIQIPITLCIFAEHEYGNTISFGQIKTRPQHAINVCRWHPLIASVHCEIAHRSRKHWETACKPHRPLLTIE